MSLTSRSLVVWLSAAMASGCTSLPRGEEPHATPHRAARTPYAVAQWGFGATARFGLCMPPVCPVVTPKHAPSHRVPAQWRVANVAERSSSAAAPSGRRLTAPLNVLTVYFESGQSILTAKARRAIAALADGMPAKQVRISAHTDSTGTYAQNSRVVRGRAAAVSRYLRAMPALAGVPLEVEAMPLCCYAANNADASGRRLNRRVDITWTAADGAESP